MAIKFLDESSANEGTKRIRFIDNQQPGGIGGFGQQAATGSAINARPNEVSKPTDYNAKIPSTLELLGSEKAAKALPYLGGIAGSIVGSVVPGAGTLAGGAIGTGIGKGLERGIVGTEDPTESKIDTIGSSLASGAIAAASDYVVGKGLGLVGKGVGLAKNRLAKSFAKLLGNTPGEDAVNIGVQKVSADLRISPVIARRTFNRTDKVLTDKFLDAGKDSHLTPKTINNVKNIADKALQSTRDLFESEIKPVLKASTEHLDIRTPYLKMMNNLSEIGTFKKGKFSAGAAIDDDIAKVFNEFIKRSGRTIGNPRPNDVHKLKQFINKIIDNPKVSSNQSAKNVLFELKSDIRSVLDDSVPGYKAVTNDFNALFTLEKEIGANLKPQNVEKLVSKYLKPDEEGFRQTIDSFLSKNRKANDIFNNALDEWSGHEFMSSVSKSQQIPIGKFTAYSRVLDRIVGGSRTASSVGKGIKKAVSKIGKTPRRQAIPRAIVRASTPQQQDDSSVTSNTYGFPVVPNRDSSIL